MRNTRPQPQSETAAETIKRLSDANTRYLQTIKEQRRVIESQAKLLRQYNPIFT